MSAELTRSPAMLVEGLLLIGLVLQTTTLLREGLSPPKANVISLVTTGIISVLQLILSMIFSILFMRRGKRAPLRPMIFLFILLCILVVGSVWTFPIQEPVEYRIHTFGNLFVLAGAVGTTTAVVLKRELKLPEKVGPIVKRVFMCGVSSVLMTPPVMRITDNVVYYSLLMATSMSLIAPAFAGFVRRSFRPLYLKLTPFVFLGLLGASCFFAVGYYKKIIKTPQNSVDGQIVTDVVMVIVAAIIGVVSETLLFIKAMSMTGEDDESFSHSSEAEKLVVADESEYSSTLPKRSAQPDGDDARRSRV